jgi:hypothetical protein
MEPTADEPEYLIAAIRDTLAKDPRVSEIELDVDVRDGTATVRGSVQTEERCRAIDQVLAERFPDLEVRNEVTALDAPEPPAEEDVQ